MASSLVESLASDFDPSAFEDTYQAALEQLIEAKVAAGGAQALPAQDDAAASAGRTSGGEVIDLLSALQRSVEKARAARGEPAPVPQRAPAAKRGRSGSTRPAAARAKSADDGPAARAASAPAAPAPTKPRARTGRSTAEAQPETATTARKARTKAS